jgi:hypothetical protein
MAKRRGVQGGIDFKTPKATALWIRTNVIHKGGKVGQDYNWHMPNGDVVVPYMYGVRVYTGGKGLVDRSKDVRSGYVAPAAVGLKLRIVRKPTNGSKIVNLKVRI